LIRLIARPAPNDLDKFDQIQNLEEDVIITVADGHTISATLCSRVEEKIQQLEIEGKISKWSSPYS
jgi:regulator of replication initiation timing